MRSVSLALHLVGEGTSKRRGRVVSANRRNPPYSYWFRRDEDFFPCGECAVASTNAIIDYASSVGSHNTVTVTTIDFENDTRFTEIVDVDVYEMTQSEQRGKAFAAEVIGDGAMPIRQKGSGGSAGGEMMNVDGSSDPLKV